MTSVCKAFSSDPPATLLKPTAQARPGCLTGTCLPARPCMDCVTPSSPLGGSPSPGLTLTVPIPPTRGPVSATQTRPFPCRPPTFVMCPGLSCPDGPPSTCLPAHQPVAIGGGGGLSHPVLATASSEPWSPLLCSGQKRRALQSLGLAASGMSWGPFETTRECSGPRGTPSLGQGSLPPLTTFIVQSRQLVQFYS